MCISIQPMHYMKKDYITNLYQKDYLDDINIFFAEFINKLNQEDNPHLFLAAALVSRAVEDGDVYLDLASVSQKPFVLEINGEIEEGLPDLTEWLEKISQSPVVGSPGDFRPLILDKKNRLYLYRYWDYEKKLSDFITRRTKEDIKDIDYDLLKGGLKRLFPKTADEDYTWQKVAAVIAAFKKICVITGGPGTGKTFTMAKILALLLEQSPKGRLKILLSAPTGKAAARISESVKAAKKTLNCEPDVIEAIPSEATTIHRMLKTIPGSPYFHHNAENPLNADIVAVDEASMADLALMSKLTAAMPADARLILIGDRDQLSSVEAGFVMGDVCDRDHIHVFSEHFCKRFERLTQQRIGVPIDGHKEKPGLYDCLVGLKKSYRFVDAGEIRGLSSAVNHGEVDNAVVCLKNSQGQIYWERHSEPDALSGSLAEKVVKGYSEYLQTDDPYNALDLFSRFKILCAVKIGPFGTHAVNRLAEQILNREDLVEFRSGLNGFWYKGRPILITRNDYNLGLFNGDVGITLPDPNSSDNALYVYFPDNSGTVKKIHPNRLPDHETAYAMTVHKSQGSEFENVLLILPDRDYPVLTRELFYTGITRARKTVSIWGPEDIIKSTILRKTERTSGLKDALWGQTE